MELKQKLQEEIKVYINATGMIPHRRDFLQPSRYGLSPLATYEMVTGTRTLPAMLKRLGFDMKEFVSIEQARSEINKFYDSRGYPPQAAHFTAENGLRPIHFYCAMSGVPVTSLSWMFTKLGFHESGSRYL